MSRFLDKSDDAVVRICVEHAETLCSFDGTFGSSDGKVRTRLDVKIEELALVHVVNVITG